MKKIRTAKPTVEQQKTIDAVGVEITRQDTRRDEHDAEIIVGEDEIRKRSRRSFIILASLLAIAFAAVALLLYWSTYPYKVLEIKEIKVASKEAKLGNDYYVGLHVDYCKGMNTEGLVERFMVSDVVEIRLPTYSETLKSGCNKVEAPTLIPASASTNDYYFRYRITYQVNPVKTVVEEFKTNKFHHERDLSLN